MMLVKKSINIILVVTSVILIYCSLSLSPILFKKYNNENENDFILIAHRGASKLAPENTLESIKNALTLGANFIEIDVHQTLDSTLVLIHDETLDRTTTGKGLVKNKTFDEISKLDAGLWFSKKIKNVRVPSLEKVIKIINGKSNLIIEIKKGGEYYPNIEKNIVKLIQKYKAENWIIIHSFDTKILKTINFINSKIKLNKLIIGKFRFLPLVLSTKIEILDFEELDFIDGYNINYCFANKKVINLLKLKNKKVNVWTVNEKQIAKDLNSLGVDGIITDNLSIFK